MWIDKDQDEENLNQQPDSLNSPSVGAGAGGGNAPIQTSGTPTIGTPSSMNPTPDAPTQQFGTIQDYFKGSRNQGERLGEQFTTKLEDTRQKQQSSIGQAADKAKQDINANTIGFNADLVSRAATDPTKVTGNEDQFDQFMKQWNASYQGPQSFETSDKFSEAAKAAQTAADKAVQTGSTGGRQQLLQDEFGVYGQGNKGLDEALLQQSSYFPAIGEKAKELISLQDYLKSQASDVTSKAKEAKGITEQTRTQTQEPFANKLTEFKTNIDQKVATKKADAQKIADKYKENLTAAGKLNGDPTALLQDVINAGASAKEVQTLRDYFKGLQSYKMSGNLENYATMNPVTDVTPETAATPEDLANAQAYQKLTGVNYGGVVDPIKAANLPPTTVPREGRSLERLQTLANKQIENFGSADPGLLKDIEALTSKGLTTEMQPAKSPIDVQGLTSYLKGQVAPKDKDMISGNFNNAVTAALNSQPISDATGVQAGLSVIKASPEKAELVANRLIEAAHRAGDINSLYKFYQQLASIWKGNTNNTISNPQVAGYVRLLDILGKELGLTPK